MADRIVKDSGLNIFVKQTEVPAGTKTNDLVLVGAKRGLAGIDARIGQDGKSYTSVDTAALIRIDGIALAFADGAPVYVVPATKVIATGSNSGANILLGYADRAKLAAAGPLHVQLIPSAI